MKISVIKDFLREQIRINRWKRHKCNFLNCLSSAMNLFVDSNRSTCIIIGNNYSKIKVTGLSFSLRSQIQFSKYSTVVQCDDNPQRTV